MKVKTKRSHINRYPPVPEKNPGRKYSLPDVEAQTLIEAGIVERDDEDDVQVARVSGAGKSPAGAPEGDREERAEADRAEGDAAAGRSSKGTGA